MTHVKPSFLFDFSETEQELIFEYSFQFSIMNKLSVVTRAGEHVIVNPGVSIKRIFDISMKANASKKYHLMLEGERALITDKFEEKKQDNYKLSSDDINQIAEARAKIHSGFDQVEKLMEYTLPSMQRAFTDAEKKLANELFGER